MKIRGRQPLARVNMDDYAVPGLIIEYDRYTGAIQRMIDYGYRYKADGSGGVEWYQVDVEGKPSPNIGAWQTLLHQCEYAALPRGAR